MELTDKNHLKELLKSNDPSLQEKLKSYIFKNPSFTDLNFLNTLRMKAAKKGFLVKSAKKIKVALIGGQTLYPLNDFTACFLSMLGYEVIFFTGQYDNYIQEILDPKSSLHLFEPDFLIVAPNITNLFSELEVTMSFDQLETVAKKQVDELLALVDGLPKKWNKIIMNAMPIATRDLGGLRSQLPYDRNGLITRFNIFLGERTSHAIKVLDIQHLDSCYGLDQAFSSSFYLETKNIFAHDFLPSVAREMAETVFKFDTPMKKILVLDLDHTLWGGVIGDDGMTGIELGGISPRGEAYTQFQRAIKRLKDRGILLAVCSKNESQTAIEAIESHPEMILRMNDFVATKINWNPKSENLKELSKELNLGLSSFVFIDDNPVEIDIVNQYTPEVSTILLNMDPSHFVTELENCRHFEPRTFTKEDSNKSDQYQQEASRVQLKNKITNVKDYLITLEMRAEIHPFVELDVPRISQLINKSNQFNLTTIRRSETQIDALLADKKYRGLVVKLKDKFGDYGLISVLILEIDSLNKSLEIETWVMSCRVLKREVEYLLINKVVEIARAENLKKIVGRFIPTEKNIIVKDLYEELGFKNGVLDIDHFQSFQTAIKIS